MVIFTIELHQFRLKVCAEAGKYRAQVVKNFFGEDFTTVFRQEDQMHVLQENAVSSMSNIVGIIHRPK